MFCANCGSKLPDNAAFCGSCGRKASVKSFAQSPCSSESSVLSLEQIKKNVLQMPTIPNLNEMHRYLTHMQQQGNITPEAIILHDIINMQNIIERLKKQLEFTRDNLSVEPINHASTVKMENNGIAPYAVSAIVGAGASMAAQAVSSNVAEAATASEISDNFANTAESVGEHLANGVSEAGNAFSDISDFIGDLF